MLLPSSVFTLTPHHTKCLRKKTTVRVGYLSFMISLEVLKTVTLWAKTSWT